MLLVCLETVGGRALVLQGILQFLIHIKIIKDSEYSLPKVISIALLCGPGD